jgi:predicted aspartyl protease
MLAGIAWADEPTQVQQDYAAGRLEAAADGLELQHGSASGAEQLVACRLALYSNRVAQARTCIAALRAEGAQDRAALQLAAEVDWRAGDYTGAAEARVALGSASIAERLRWFAANAPYTHTRLFDQMIALERVDPLPVVRVRLGAGPTRFFIIDTGAGDTVVDRNLVDTAHIRVFGAQTGVFGGGQTAQTAIGVAPSLRLGENELRNVPVSILDTSAYDQAAPGLHISGVIGIGVLSRFISTIDYPHGRLVLRQNRVRLNRSDMIVPIWLFNDHYVVAEASINGHPYAAFIDTGLAGYACTAPRSTIEAIGVSLGDDMQGGANGAGQAVSVAPFRATLAIGAAVSPNAQCIFGPFPPQIQALGGSHIGALISHAFVRPYAVTFDFHAMQMVLSR